MHSFAAHSLRRSPDGSLAAITVYLSPYHLAGSIVGPAAFVRAGVQHRANEIGGFLMAITGDFWAVGQAIRRSNYH
jgi:predicted MPP superfamily phosphohydrolase